MDSTLQHVLLYLSVSITLGGYATGEVSREQTTSVCLELSLRFCIMLQFDANFFFVCFFSRQSSLLTITKTYRQKSTPKEISIQGM